MPFFSSKAQKRYELPCTDTSLLQLVTSASSNAKTDHSAPAKGASRSHPSARPHIHPLLPEQLWTFLKMETIKTDFPYLLLFSVRSPIPCCIFLLCLLCCSWHVFSPFPSLTLPSFWCLLASIFCIFFFKSLQGYPTVTVYIKGEARQKNRPAS